MGPGKKTFRYTFDFQVSVANYSGVAQTVELADQLPVAEVDKVTVREIEVTPGLMPAETDAPVEAAATYMREMDMMY